MEADNNMSHWFTYLHANGEKITKRIFDDGWKRDLSESTFVVLHTEAYPAPNRQEAIKVGNHLIDKKLKKS